MNSNSGYIDRDVLFSTFAVFAQHSTIFFNRQSNFKTKFWRLLGKQFRFVVLVLLFSRFLQLKKLIFFCKRLNVHLLEDLI